MPFATPLALVGLAFVPLLVAFYLLKLRREETVVPSTLLWSRLVSDLEANAPWQRLRRSLLLLLQLLLVVLLAILAARPFVERPASLARDLVVVIDTSASMGATDVPGQPNRLEGAKQAALAALGDIPSGGTVSVIAAGRTARVVANGTADVGRVREAIASIRLTDDAGDLGDAMRLASALAARSGDAQVLVATDAAVTKPTAEVRAPLRVLRVGHAGHNQAIVALAVRTSPSSVTRSVFVSVANSDVAEATRRVELWGDGQLLEARELFLDPQARADVSIDDLPASVGVVEVRLTAAGNGNGNGAAAADDLAIDDRAWAIVPPDRKHLVLLVSDGDPYLEAALSYLPNAEVYGVPPKDYGPGTARKDGRNWDLVIFDGHLPVELPPTAVLAIAPDATSPLGEVTGTLTEPAIGTPNPDEPLLQYVDLSTVHIARASRLVLPEWARTVIAGPAGAPLLYSGLRDGRPAAVLAFEPRASDLPLQVAFPVLVSNLVGELLGASTAPADAVAPGTPVMLPVAPGAIGVRVTKPDGSSVELAAPVAGAGSVQFSGADRVGVYAVEPVGMTGGDMGSPIATKDAAAVEGASPGAQAYGASPGAEASAGSWSAQSPSESDMPSEGAALAVGDGSVARFAVDLFDVRESSIAPGSAAAIEALGSAASPIPGASSTPTSVEQLPPRPPARDELWGPLVLLVLAVLAVEWAAYERDAVVRMRRGIAARIGRARGALPAVPGPVRGSRR